MARRLWTAAAIAAFIGVMWYAARAEVQVECEVCITFKGRTECRTGRGDSEASAIQSANTAACSVLGAGVTDAMQCSATAPSRLECREL